MSALSGAADSLLPAFEQGVARLVDDVDSFKTFLKGVLDKATEPSGRR